MTALPESTSCPQKNDAKLCEVHRRVDNSEGKLQQTHMHASSACKHPRRTTHISNTGPPSTSSLVLAATTQTCSALRLEGNSRPEWPHCRRQNPAKGPTSGLAVQRSDQCFSTPAAHSKVWVPEFSCTTSGQLRALHTHEGFQEAGRFAASGLCKVFSGCRHRACCCASGLLLVRQQQQVTAGRSGTCLQQVLRCRRR